MNHILHTMQHLIEHTWNRQIGDDYEFELGQKRGRGERERVFDVLNRGGAADDASHAMACLEGVEEDAIADEAAYACDL